VWFAAVDPAGARWHTPATPMSPTASPLAPLTLVLGGARSGKSAYAQRRTETAAAQHGSAPVMIATAQAFDAEMEARIAAHRAERGDGWRTIEAPLDLAAAVEGLKPGEAATIDCLTLWLSNLILADQDVAAASGRLVAILTATQANLCVVSNEVGMGIVPDNALARRFRDEAGRLHQQVAAAAGCMVVMFAGVALTLKGGT
jgi:adenosylcobinamide kinase / adenosylcobinamide-phosphate guanylyltransferase